MMFLDCPAYGDDEGTLRCGLPAEVTCRFTLHSTDGPVEGATIRCPAGHWFNGPIESLTREDSHNAGSAAAGRHDRVAASNNGPDGSRDKALESLGTPSVPVDGPLT
jgi:hypothetical protein